MSKIELSIKVDYVPSWGVWEGMREIIQNGLDAEQAHGAKLSITRLRDVVRIENVGVSMPIEALLLGHSTSRDSADLRGEHGEGLDLGLLALVRSGRSVKIRSGDEVWTPAIEPSKKFNADVLTVDVQSGRAAKNRVRVEVDGVDDAEWQNIQQRFLVLAAPSAGEIVDTPSGDLLLGDRFKGQLFVKGIYVQTDPALNYGYNYSDVGLDRDRRMVDSWDKNYRNHQIWQHAVRSRPDLFNQFFAMISEGMGDADGISEYTANTMEIEVVDQITARFTEQFGADAVPVETLEQSKDIAHLGKIGVIVKDALRHIVQRKIGSVEAVTHELRTEIVKTYGYHELSLGEADNLHEAIVLVDRARNGADLFSKVDVVDFRTNGIMGQFKDGRYALAHKLLSDPRELLATLVHEVAHENGGDGEIGHVAELERIWGGIVSYLQDINTNQE